jgi:hypothetical protein
MHEIGSLFTIGIAGIRNVQSDRSDVLRLKAPIDLEELEKTVQQQAARYQTHRAQAHLQRDQQRAQPAAALSNGCSARAGPHGFLWISL